jgi:phage tail sheath gpL-like
VNKAFEINSEQRDTDNNNSLYNGISTATAADEKRNVVCIVIVH